MRKSFLIILILVLQSASTLLKAGNVVTNARIEEPAFSGSGLGVRYDKYASLPGQQPNSTKGIIEVGIDELKKIYHLQEFTSVVTITYDYDNLTLSNSGIQNQVFVVNFDPVQKYKPQSFYLLQNAASISIHSISVITYKNYGTVGQSVVSDPGDLYVEATIDADETPAFNFSAPLPISANMGYNIISVASQAREMEVFWEYILGAEQYEMEYIHVDNYDASSLSSSKSPGSIDYDFLHDATRIVTSNQYYRIPLVFERGYILFRVRGIGRSSTNNNIRLEGTWSNAGFEISDVGTFSGNFPNQIYGATAHEFDNIEWECIETFAEGGKSGIAINYEDALSKSRQSVAKLNTENKTMAQSTLYDWYGRPAISVLPTPIDESYLGYKQNLNRTASGTQFDKIVFDNSANFQTPDPCNPNGLQMSSVQSSGAAKYYSINNPDKEAQQAMVPDADGYPYVQIEYYPDQEGRIKRQSTPGNTHFLGSSKEAFYNYTQPTQKELCRLFGTEVGRYDEYEKLTEIDPNGQISVSYTDDEGRVIASGLYGAQPANVEPIEGALDPAANISTPLINNLNDPQNFVLEIGNSFFAAAGETQSIDYAVTVPVYTDANCAPNLCMDCIYELEISVKDQCGEEILDGDGSTPGNQAVSQVLGRYAPNSNPPFSVSCPSPNTSLNFTFGTPSTPFTFNVPKNGTYYLTKTLKLSTLPLQYYAQQFISSNTNTCVTPLSSFQNDALQDIDISNCVNFDCSNCTTAVNSAVVNMNPPLSQAQIDLLIEKCQLKCDMKNMCKSREKLMRMQFKPGGYFAKYNTGGPNYASTSPYSIFNPSNILGSALQISPSGSYAYDNVPPPGYGGYTVNDPITNLPVAPSQLSIINYVAAHNSNFSNPWLQWHPEYCKLQFYCDGLISAIMSYSDAIYGATSYNDACIKGLLYPFPSAMALPSAPLNGNCPNGCAPGTGQYMPLFNYAGSSNFSLGQINSAFSAFTNSFSSTTFNSTSGSVTGNIYEFAVAASNSLVLNPGGLPPLGSSGNCDIDFEWLTYKQFYLNLIKNAIFDLRSTFVSTWNIANGGCLTDPQLAGLPNYSKIFEDPNMANYPVIGSLPNVSTTPTNVLVGNVQSNMQSTCLSLCQSYVASWLNDLAPCGIIPGATWNAMQNDLVAVCAAGCGAQNPFGASNCASPGVILSGTTPAVPVTSFQDVLNAYGYTQSANCNQFLINWPKPQGSNIGTNAGGGSGGLGPAGTPTIDACSCDKIRNTHNDYINKVNSSGINPCVITESAYFQQTLGVNLPNLSTYTCICSQAYNSTTGTYNFANVTAVPSLSLTILPVPAALGCSNCIPCTSFGTTVPFSSIWDGHFSSIGITSFAAMAAANSTVVTNILNAQYNMNNTYDEWMDFFADCQNNLNTSTGTFSGANGITSQTSPQAYAMSTFFNTLYNLGYLNLNTGATTYTLTQTNAPSFFSSSLWTLPNNLTSTVQVLVTNNSGSLQVQVYNQPSTYNCNFTIPLPAGISPSAVGTLPGVSIKTVKGMCDASGLAIRSYYGTFKYYDVVTSAYVTTNVIISNSCYNSLVTPNIPNPQCEPYLCSTSLSGGIPGSTSSPSTSCLTSQINNALNQASTNYNNYIQQVVEDFVAAYKDHCYNNVVENFERGYFLNEYQYTLYYYDRAGNMVHTVPSASVHVLTGTPLTNATNYVMSGTGSAVYPNHSLNQSTGINSYLSHTSYNSLDAPLKQVTPDGGESVYFYDGVGRIAASRDAQQLIDNTYSYILYDELGRITEGGIISGITTALASSITINPIRWRNYLTGLTKTEVTHSYYDRPLNGTTNSYFPNGQKSLFNKISATTFEQIDDGNDNTFDNGSFYSYDEHGYVSYVVQEKTNGYLKSLEYEYELISQNVSKIIYNRGAIDQLFSLYYYDKDNRISQILTSQNGTVYQRDVKYLYYQHGPLARTEIGEKQVQATDYAFTLLGWIKGVNSNLLNSNNDMGKDGDLTTSYLSSQAALHGDFATDGAAYTLNYFTGDYNPIKNAASVFIADMTNLNSGSAVGFKTGSDAPDLYNGSIASMVTSIYDINVASDDIGIVKPQITGYKYDQLHRIRHTKAYNSLCINTTNSTKHKEGIDLMANQWKIPTSTNYVGVYESTIDYDKLGNIKSLERKGDAIFSGSWGIKTMDNLTYNYQTNAGIITSIGTIQKNNQLTHVDEDLSIPSANYPTDIEDQIPNNYTYNGTGSLTKDLNEEIQTINWTSGNKVRSVIRTSGSTKPDVHYEFDAFDRKIYKKIVYKSAPGVIDPNKLKETFYTLDLNGKLIGLYERVTTVAGSNTTVVNTCKELNLYGFGLERIGLINADIDMSSPIQTNSFDISFGAKDYELLNHLGNVITTISDRKRAIDGTYQYAGYAAGNYNFDTYTYNPVTAFTGVFNQLTPPNGIVDSYFPDIKTTSDYYAFGHSMAGRSYATGGTKYRYGFNGKESQDEISEGEYDFGERIYDARIGRFFSADPEEVETPEYSPYAFANNNPISLIDEDGLSAAGPPWLELLSAGLDFIPIVGTIKNIAEAAIGYDLTGAKIAVGMRLAMLLPYGKIAVKTAKAVKYVVKHADDIIKVTKKVWKKVVKKSEAIFKKGDDVKDISSQVVGKIDRKELIPPTRKGKAPTFKDGTGVDLHHVDGKMDGPIIEMSTPDHMALHRKIGFNKKSKIERQTFRKQREKYWDKQYIWHHRKVKASNLKKKMNGNLKKFKDNVKAKIKKVFKKRPRNGSCKAKF